MEGQTVDTWIFMTDKPVIFVTFGAPKTEWANAQLQKIVFLHELLMKTTSSKSLAFIGLYWPSSAFLGLFGLFWPLISFLSQRISFWVKIKCK